MSDPQSRLRPVSIVTVTFDGYFFARLLVEKIREFIGPREYEIIVVDRGSKDGTREWMTRDDAAVAHETNGAVTRANYLEPLLRQLRAAYLLDY